MKRKNYKIELKTKVAIVSLLAFVLLFLPLIISAQSPELMSYQAVVRDAGSNLVKNSQVGMRISILQSTADGSSVYEEEYTVTTNANGLVSLEIGSASPNYTGTSLKNSTVTEATSVSGDFSDIDWVDGPYFIKVETDPTGGTNYTISGVSQLLSVPYALHAKSASNVKFTDGDDVADAAYTKGNVGIGTTSPSADLDIFNSSTNAVIKLYGWNGLHKAWLSRFTNRLHIASNDMIQFGTGGQTDTDVTIDKNGNVSVGKQSGDTGSRFSVFNTVEDDKINMGISSTVDGTGTAYHMALKNVLSGEGTGPQYGVHTSIDNSGNGKHYANYAELYGSGSGIHYGGYNFLRGDGTGVQYGVSNVIANTGNAAHYGNYCSLYGAGSGTHYASYNVLMGAGEGSQYGSYSYITNSGNGIQMGNYNEILGAGSGYHYGIKNYLKGSGSGRQYGIYNNINNSGDALHYGVFNDVWGEGNGAQYGSYSDLSGTGSGNKYGSYNIIRETAGGTHYAVYGDARKEGSYAGYFNGDVKMTQKLKGNDSGDADMKAYVYGKILLANYNGSAEIIEDVSTDGFDVKKTDSFHFLIDFKHAVPNAYTVVATLNSTVGFISVETFDSYFTVDVYDKDGDRNMSRCEFSFVVYKK